MASTKNIIEKEYRFLINPTALKILPPQQIGHFERTHKKVVKHTDYLFERRNTPLKNENIGFRIRKTNDSMEFTYKHFLGKKDGVVNYDEFTTNISPNLLKSFKKGVFKHKDLPILEKLQQKGQLYFLLEIANQRTIYTYSHGENTIQLMLEEIKYKNKSKTANDSMIEIEINIMPSEQEQMDLFVRTIKERYSCEPMDEGKNTRAERLLVINQ